MTNQELIDKTNKIISELVYSKTELQKAYNYYNGVRDIEQFRYLEENFGIGNPTSIKFTPLIKKHIDALIGEYLGIPIIPKVSCKDSETIQHIGRDKQMKIISELHKTLSASFQKSVLNFLEGKDNKDPLLKQELDKLIDEIDQSFISDYEIAAQNVIEYIMQSRHTDLITVLRDLFLDLLITGYAYYRVEPTVEGQNIKIRPLNPLNTFTDQIIDTPYIKNAERAVIRNWMTKVQILNKYGKELSKKDRDYLEDHWMNTYDSNYRYVKHCGASKGILGNTDVQVEPGYPSDENNGIFTEYIPVYEVEWIEVDKNYVMNRYESVRIGEDIYIIRGKSDNVIRSKDNPTYCSLSINGICFLNRGHKPFSLMLSCTDLQDQYDILHFFKDRVIASSGSLGDFVDVAMLPTFLGSDVAERLQKFIAYKKNGIAPIDSSQPGRLENGQANPMNQIFGGYDDTIKAPTIQAIMIAIENLEKTASDITGVFRERLGGIEQRDAVNNVKVSQNNSFIVTKQYYHQMDLIVNELLLDCLNLAKKVYKNGLTGTIILGDKYQKIFTALPEHFTLTDYDIRIVTSSDVIKDIEYVKQLIPEFVKAGSVSPDIIFEAMTVKSLSELKAKVRRAIQKQKEENNQIQQLSQQLQEAQKQLEDSSKQVKQLQQKVEQLNEQKIQVENQKAQLEYKVDWYKAQTERTYREAMVEEAKRRTELEIAQLSDGNPYNNQIRQVNLS